MNVKILIAVLYFTCFNGFNSIAQNKNIGAPAISIQEIFKTDMSVYKYNGIYLKLAEDFTSYDQRFKMISKPQFLKLLTTGQYLPLRFYTKDGTMAYKLYKMPPLLLKKFQGVYKQLGEQYFTFYKMEGKPLPRYSFIDLNGKKYNPLSTKGKILVLKCWFIHCQVCIEEMPQLNELVDQYKNRKDIIFLSLALDTKNELVAFLKTKKFNYSVVPNMESYMSNSLKIGAYPTHLIINKRGLIFKVVSSANELVTALNKEALN